MSFKEPKGLSDIFCKVLSYLLQKLRKQRMSSVPTFLK